ncbi:chromosome transmission fidelity protein 18 homolog [Coccinella septempunctata]|uniref:chromosome transmission fidelity protein 18 homolog n=1 Tax=Coccinella septempunctata TaxID=41139 RepID=UPI001D05CF51|nr:chromosome transmission fidelity protein 18 homolog [Coccinella septempunctata]
MGDYPNSDEEFELQYGDELELLNEVDDFDEPVVRTAENKARKSLDYGLQRTVTTNTQSDLFFTQSQESNSSRNNLDNSFTTDFQPLNERNDNNIPKNVADSNDCISQAPSTSLINTAEQPPTKKRTIEELFGDIDDLLFENERKAKKSRPDTKLEQQMEMIGKILELRKQREENDNILFRKNNRISVDDRDKLNLSWRVPAYPFISITRHDKERFYVRCHSDDYEKEDVSRVIKDINFVGVMGDMFKETWQKAQEIMNKNLDDSTKNEDVQMELEEVEEDNELWVDLYKPKRYLELLSDEATNRVMLKWLKLWDKVVFNRRPKIRPENIEPLNKARTKFNFINIIDNQLKLDEDGRPLYKVAMLCGRPGLGKTTLAHVVARHAGYNVIEINASDDRSLESFRTSLENATQMRSVIDQQKRPNCIIFDEIDGAPANSIEFLVKFINGTVVRGKKKEKGGNTLKRPIICICNDAYVPALRSLRQIAFIVNFPPTSSGRLSERLLEICRKQLLHTDVGAMLALAEKSNNDIRSCLSILHFFKTKKRAITLSDVYRSNIGQKDMQKGLFSVWTDIFSIERAKVKFSGMQNMPKEDKEKNYDMSYKARMQKVLGVVQSFGDYERLAQGVFENFPQMQIKEASLVGTCQALNWFCYTDKINRFIMSEQNYSLSSYLPYAFVVWHFQFSSLVWPKIKYPNEGYEVRQKLKNNTATVKEMIQGVQPKVRVFVNAKNLILDTLPLLTRIISPSFRPVNFHLFTTEEKEMFVRVVEIMIDYNLNYVQEKNSAGIYEFKLDPDVMPIVMFPNISQDRKVLSYFNKQLLSREVEIERIKKVQISTRENPASNNSKKDVTLLKSPEEQKLPNHLQRLKVKSLKKIEPAVTKDFFGRIIQTPTGSNKGPQLHGDIWYKYKEGYSNAVRKKIKMSSLL